MGAPPLELRKGLKQRHLTMIVMGGVIGAGLFVGSGTVISEAGPSAFLSCAITGVLIILVMRMLGAYDLPLTHVVVEHPGLPLGAS